MADRKYVDRIRKLLRLSTSPNQHEAASALQRAMDLAAKYRVDLEALGEAEDLKTILHTEHRAGERLSLEKKLAIGVVEIGFNVSCIVDQPDVIFVGQECDIRIATYAYDFVVRACCESWKSYRVTLGSRKPSTARRRNFVRGFFYGIISTLQKTRSGLQDADPGAALIVIDDEQRRKDYIESEFGRLRPLGLPSARLDRTALYAGALAGRETTITKPVEAATERRALVG